MRRGLLVIIPIALLFACGGDDSDAQSDTADTADTADTSGDSSTFADEYGDDPTLEECIEGMRYMLGTIEVPDGVDPTDGIDGDETAKVDAEVSRAFTDYGLDPDGENDPCAKHSSPEADAALATILEELDPAVLAMLQGA